MKPQPGQPFRVRGDTQVRHCIRCEPRVCCGGIYDVVDDADGRQWYADKCEAVEGAYDAHGMYRAAPAETNDPPFSIGDRVRIKASGRIETVRACGWATVGGLRGTPMVDLGDRWRPADDVELATVVDAPPAKPTTSDERLTFFDSRGRYLGDRTVRG